MSLYLHKYEKSAHFDSTPPPLFFFYFCLHLWSGPRLGSSSLPSSNRRRRTIAYWIQSGAKKNRSVSSRDVGENHHFELIAAKNTSFIEVEQWILRNLRTLVNVPSTCLVCLFFWRLKWMVQMSTLLLVKCLHDEHHGPTKSQVNRVLKTIHFIKPWSS